MNNRLRALCTIVGVRERQHPRLEEALTAQRQLLAARQAEHADAHQHQQDCLERQMAAAQRRTDLLEKVFNPQQAMAMDLVLRDLQRETQNADQRLGLCDKAVVQQQAAVQASFRQVRRNEQRIATLKERIADLRREHDQAEEEATDEESADNHTARALMRYRIAEREACAHA
jgi:DNA repair exonuclease SbcCD ATPase subunit